MSLWTQQTASEATQGKANGTWQASRVEIDSRRIQPGDLFIALKGERFDGHDYVVDALAKGAAAAVVSSPQEKGNFLLVPDTQKALEDLACFARARSSAKIVGVTGSVGKTSTKEMLKLALSAHGKTYATAGNYNNHIGTPLNLANLPLDAEFGVFEMGMNHAGEITPLTQMVRPNVAIITNVEAAHLEFFASVQEIADAKAEIFDGMRKGGVAVLNADNAWVSDLEKAARRKGINVVTCGTQQGDWQLVDYRIAQDHSQITASRNGKQLDYTLSAIGKHWAMTSLLALAAADALGLDTNKTAKALVAFIEPEGRGRLSRLDSGALIIDDSYNASPAAMEAAIAKTAELWDMRGRKGRKLAALGDMMELGTDAKHFHEEVASELQKHGFHRVFTAGPLMQYSHQALPPEMRGAHVASASALISLLREELKQDDILLIKGSHGSKMYEVAKALAPAKETKHAV